MIYEVCNIARTCASCVFIGCVMVFSEDGSTCVNLETAVTLPFNHLAFALNECGLVLGEPIHLTDYIYYYLTTCDYKELMMLGLKLALKKLWGMGCMYGVYWLMSVVGPVLFPQPQGPPPLAIPLAIEPAPTEEALPEENEVPAEEPGADDEDEADADGANEADLKVAGEEEILAQELAPRAPRRRRTELDWLRANLEDDLQFRGILQYVHGLKLIKLYCHNPYVASQSEYSQATIITVIDSYPVIS